MRANIDQMRSWQQKNCCICGSQNCFESVDHSQLLLPELQSIISKTKLNQENVSSIKKRIKDTYSGLKRVLIQSLQSDQQIFQEWVNQFYFPQLAGKVNMNLLCKLVQKNYQLLPNKALSGITKQINRNKSNLLHFDSTSQHLASLKCFLDQINIQKIVQKSLRYLGGQYIAGESNFSPTSSKLGSSQLIKLEESQVVPQKYEWKNVKLNHNSRVAELSNKNLKDQDLIKELPRIGCFRNLKQFQVRNNFITGLSCRVIVNNLSFIHTLDVRGNKIGDIGVQVIAKGLSHLKSLLISDTQATDRSGKVIADSMMSLQLFWAQNNHLSGATILNIASKAKLKVMSVSGNPVDDKHKGLLYQLFLRKGYVVI